MSETTASSSSSSSSSSRKRPGGGDDPGKGLKSTGLEETEDGADVDECAICLDSIEVEGSLDDCDHRFCHSCILTWAETENRCPCCRKRFHMVTRTVRGGCVDPEEAEAAAAAAAASAPTSSGGSSSSGRRSSNRSGGDGGSATKRPRATTTRVQTRDQGEARRRLLIDGIGIGGVGMGYGFLPMPPFLADFDLGALLAARGTGVGGDGGIGGAGAGGAQAQGFSMPIGLGGRGGADAGGARGEAGAGGEVAAAFERSAQRMMERIMELERLRGGTSGLGAGAALPPRASGGGTSAGAAAVSMATAPSSAPAANPPVRRVNFEDYAGLLGITRDTRPRPSSYGNPPFQRRSSSTSILDPRSRRSSSDAGEGGDGGGGDGGRWIPELESCHAGTSGHRLGGGGGGDGGGSSGLRIRDLSTRHADASRGGAGSATRSSGDSAGPWHLPRPEFAARREARRQAELDAREEEIMRGYMTAVPYRDRDAPTSRSPTAAPSASSFGVSQRRQQAGGGGDSPGALHLESRSGGALDRQSGLLSQADASFASGDLRGPSDDDTDDDPDDFRLAPRRMASGPREPQRQRFGLSGSGAARPARTDVEGGAVVRVLEERLSQQGGLLGLSRDEDAAGRREVAGCLARGGRRWSGEDILTLSDDEDEVWGGRRWHRRRRRIRSSAPSSSAATAASGSAAAASASASAAAAYNNDDNDDGEVEVIGTVPPAASAPSYASYQSYRRRAADRAAAAASSPSASSRGAGASAATPSAGAGTRAAEQEARSREELRLRIVQESAVMAASLWGELDFGAGGGGGGGDGDRGDLLPSVGGGTRPALSSFPHDILDDPLALLPPFPPTGARGRRSAPPSTTSNSNTINAPAGSNAAGSTSAAGPAAMMPAPVSRPASRVVATAGGAGPTVEHLGGMMLPGLGVNVYVLRAPLSGPPPVRQTGPQEVINLLDDDNDDDDEVELADVQPPLRMLDEEETEAPMVAFATAPSNADTEAPQWSQRRRRLRGVVG